MPLSESISAARAGVTRSASGSSAREKDVSDSSGGESSPSDGSLLTAMIGVKVPVCAGGGEAMAEARVVGRGDV